MTTDHDSRFRDGTSRWAFMDEFLVVCPKCDRCATVRPASNQPRGDAAQAPMSVTRLHCSACGLVRDWDGVTHAKRPDVRDVRVRRLKSTGALVDVTTGKQAWIDASGTDRDPYFGLPLWLRGEVRGRTLWARNARHLDYIESYVAARLREDFLGRSGTIGAYGSVRNFVSERDLMACCPDGWAGWKEHADERVPRLGGYPSRGRVQRPSATPPG